MGGGAGRTEGRTDGRLEIPPCVLLDIGPLGPLPKKGTNRPTKRPNDRGTEAAGCAVVEHATKNSVRFNSFTVKERQIAMRFLDIYPFSANRKR